MQRLRLLAALAAVIAVLITFGTGTAAADGDEAPIIINAFPNAPGMVTLEWVHTGDDVFWFVVEMETPFAYWPTPHGDTRIWSVSGLEPSTTYRFRVCAVYDFNRVCSDEDGVGYVSITTMPPEQPPPPPPPPAHAPLPAPVLTARARSVSEIYLTWEHPGYEARLTSATLYRDGGAIYEALQPGNFDSDHVDVVQQNSTHRYHMCFRNPDEEKCSAPITASPAPAPTPPAPGALTPPRNVQWERTAGGTSATITWELGTGATYYQVQCVDTTDTSQCGLPFRSVDGRRGLDTAANPQQVLWETTSYTFKNLNRNHTYTVAICSANAGDGAGPMPDPTACAPDMTIGPSVIDVLETRPTRVCAVVVGGCPEETSALPYGPDTCKPGYVWREAFQGDTVCVTPETRTQAAADNAQAAARREPNGGAYGPDTCKPGFVWREARPSDHVCVTPETRDQTALDNSLANQRRVVPR